MANGKDYICFAQARNIFVIIIVIIIFAILIVVVVMLRVKGE